MASRAIIHGNYDGGRHVSIVNKNVVSNDVHHWLLATRWDITDLIRIQEQLQEVNQQLRMAFSVTNTVPMVWDLEDDLIRFKYPEFKVENKGFSENLTAKMNPSETLLKAN